MVAATSNNFFSDCPSDEDQSGTSGHDTGSPAFDAAGGNQQRSRLNLLVSYAGWRQQSWAEQLPALLQPMGIVSWRVESGREARDVLVTQRVHIAIVDLGMPLEKQPRQASGGSHPAAGTTSNPGCAESAAGSSSRTSNLSSSTGDDSAGTRLLQVLRRLDAPPPTVVIRRPADQAHTNQARTLHEALREGAFAVLDNPVHLEQVLDVLRRILRRYYADGWPDAR